MSSDEPGALVQIGRAERNRLWEAQGVLDLRNDHERAAATPGGNTRAAAPQRPGPAPRGALTTPAAAMVGEAAAPVVGALDPGGHYDRER
jgi:hypothetical protein